MSRLDKGRHLRTKILIVCEGEETEPNYFRCFACKPEVKPIPVDPINMVNRAIDIKNEYTYDQSWCVFDIEDKISRPQKQIQHAISLAKKNGIRVAYSNEAFEIWYLLHFEYRNTGVSRNEFQKILTARFKSIAPKFKYEKNSKDMYELLKDKQGVAIRNAKKLRAHHETRNTPPAEANPSTTVHLLVEELNKLPPSSR